MRVPPTIDRPSPAGRAPSAAAVRAIALALVVGCAGVTLGCAPGPGPGRQTSSGAPISGSSANAAVPSASAGVDRVSARALDALLSRREKALADHDRSGFAATVADPESPDGLAQLSAFETAADLGVVGLAHDPSFTRATPASPGVLSVLLAYRVRGVDTCDRTARVDYHLESTRGEWRIASEHPSGTGSTAPWLALAGARVHRTEHAVVAGTVPAGALGEDADMVERARAALSRSWDLPDRVLVLAPSSESEADVLLGRAAGGAPVAATTEGPVGKAGTATGDRVVLDPDAFDRLTPAGRQVVIAHELTHVAVRATVPGRAEPWVSEGYADHIGYGYAGLPAEHIAAPLVMAVRAGQAPTALPGALDVDPSRGDIEVAYLASWQAVQVLVDRHGEEAVRRFVRAATSTGSEQDVRVATDRALREVLGTTREDLTRDWQARLHSLAG
ncbi:MAG: DUF4157 domain-containing protein [Ornithinibacter sp.]